MPRFGQVPRAALHGVLIAALGVPPGALAQEKGPQKPPTAPQKPEYSISVESRVVNVDVVVTDQDGNVLTGLKKENFRVLDNGQPQMVTNFAPTEAPITIVILMEFSRIGYEVFAYTAKEWGYDFLRHLGPKDWVALVTYDLRPKIQVDFTRNKMEVENTIAGLYFPGFSEANLFDALIDTLDRLQDVKGKKSILLLSSGFDTFSKHTLDDTLKRVKQSDVTIFCVGVGEDLINYLDAQGALGTTSRLDYLQGQNELTTFANLTGGYAWFPRFSGEMPSIFNSVAAMLRNQYTLAFVPPSQSFDGKFHKIKVEVVDNAGNPLFVTDKKGKKRKIIVYARQGYMAPRSAVGD